MLRLSTKHLQHAKANALRKKGVEGSGACSWLRKKFFGDRRRQLMLTFNGTALIVVGIIVAIVLYTIIQAKVSTSLDDTAKLYRNSLPEEVLEEIANNLVPIYRSVVRWRSRVQVGGDWPPLAGAYQDDPELLSRLGTLLHTELDAETHVRYVSPDGNWKLQQDFVATGAVLALQSDLVTPATNLEECVGVGIVELRHDYHTHILPGHGYVYRATYQRAVAGELRSDDFLYDAENASVVFPAEAQLPVVSCSTMMEGFWNSTGQGAGSAFGDWNWLLDAQGYLTGSWPIYSGPNNGNSSARIGRMFSTVALAQLAQTALRLIRETQADPEWTVGGDIMLYTADNRILGQTETEATVLTLDDLPPAGKLSRGISELRSATGEACPAEGVNINTDDGRLVDFRPFTAEEHGMPPLSEGRWCIVMTLPRENLYGPIDEAETLAISAGAIVIIVQFFATALLGLAVFLGMRIIRGIQKEKLKVHFRKVQAAAKDVKLLNCPMALISAGRFLQMQRLEPHESLRNKGLLVILDSLEGPEGIHKFQEDNMIVFFSHQWVGNNFPDSDDALQLQSMKGALQSFQKRQQSSKKDVYVWLDYVSIAQRHPKMMMAAVSSLPVYASIADAFVIVAPPAVHAAFGHECDLRTYSQRGWCRAEMLAKACGSGLQNFYTCIDKEGELAPITDLTQFSLNVFEGDFTVETDKESLVLPVLGLYSLVLRAQGMSTSTTSEHMHIIHEHIAEDKDAFFPRSYTNPSGERVELFGPLVELLEGAMEEANGEDDEAKAAGQVEQKA